MSKATYFFLNGDPYVTDSELTLLDLVQYFNSNRSLLVLEHNRFLCPSKNWDQILIHENDRIEMVTIVGGG